MNFAFDKTAAEEEMIGKNVRGNPYPIIADAFTIHIRLHLDTK